MQETVVTLPNGEEKTILHRGSGADRGVLHEVFVQKVYSIMPLRRRQTLLADYSAILASGRTPLVLDVGSNIGASVCWFAAAFPEARIVAIEPDFDNFNHLTVNTAGLNAELHLAALGSRAGRARVEDTGRGAWGYQAHPDLQGETKMLAIGDLVAGEVAAGFVPFIVKIDIEGGEKDLFQPPCDWVDAFPLLMIELHDWMLPGAGTARPFLAAMAARDRDFIHAGPTVYSIRNG